jgi:hypothetical protein
MNSDHNDRSKEMEMLCARRVSWRAFFSAWLPLGDVLNWIFWKIRPDFSDVTEKTDFSEWDFWKKISCDLQKKKVEFFLEFLFCPRNRASYRTKKSRDFQKNSRKNSTTSKTKKSRLSSFEKYCNLHLLILI